MSAESAEYLKRTCLICGCHTNLTINIYEPRSGPNIVQLIQAKFKFQPLNDDKYLCFSCNNWLINWHSLQAPNSNEAESPAGATFRASTNNSALSTAGASAGVALPQQQQHVVAVGRPVAHVRPRLSATLASASPKHTAAQRNTASPTPPPPPPPQRDQLSYIKRSFHVTAFTCRRKSLQHCCICGRCIIIRVSSKSALRKSHTARCRKCREICKRRSVRCRYNAMLKTEHQKLRRLCKSPLMIAEANLVHSNSKTNYNNNSKRVALRDSQSLCLPKPSVDGKVVAMLRRLGTTLSREQASASASVPAERPHCRLPTIMSPSKQKPRWTRPLDDDEIVLDFNSAITEVLPLVAAQPAGASSVRRTLTYQVTAAPLSLCGTAQNGVAGIQQETEAKVKTEVQRKQPQCTALLESFYGGCMPQGLSVTLI